MFFDIPSEGLISISHTTDCDPIPAVLKILKEVPDSLFLGLMDNYANYSSLIRRAGIRTELYEVISEWVSNDLPLTEETPPTWCEPQNTIEFDQLISDISEISNGRPIVIDSILPIYFRLEQSSKGVLKFIHTLLQISPLVILTYNSELDTDLRFIQQISTLHLTMRPLSTGFSKQYTGQISVESRQDMIKTETGRQWYKLESANLMLIH